MIAKKFSDKRSNGSETRAYSREGHYQYHLGVTPVILKKGIFDLKEFQMNELEEKWIAGLELGSQSSRTSLEWFLNGLSTGF